MQNQLLLARMQPNLEPHSRRSQHRLPKRMESSLQMSSRRARLYLPKASILTLMPKAIDSLQLERVLSLLRAIQDSQPAARQSKMRLTIQQPRSRVEISRRASPDRKRRRQNTKAKHQEKNSASLVRGQRVHKARKRQRILRGRPARTRTGGMRRPKASWTPSQAEGTMKRQPPSLRIQGLLQTKLS